MNRALIGFASLALLAAGCATDGSSMTSTERAASSAVDVKALKEECERIEEIYPRLMLAAMMEGPMICGDPHMGEEFDCHEGETAEEKAEREQRRKLLEEQELAAKKADMACDAFEEDLENMERQELAYKGVRAAMISQSHK